MVRTLTICVSHRWQKPGLISKIAENVAQQSLCHASYTSPHHLSWTDCNFIDRMYSFFCFLSHFYWSNVTHTRLTALSPGLPGWAGTRKVKPIWISLKQETVSGSGISWAICKSAPRSRQITTPAPNHSTLHHPQMSSVDCLKTDIMCYIIS